jgi:hypothetical protein
MNKIQSQQFPEWVFIPYDKTESPTTASRQRRGIPNQKQVGQYYYSHWKMPESSVDSSYLLQQQQQQNSSNNNSCSNNNNNCCNQTNCVYEQMYITLVGEQEYTQRETISQKRIPSQPRGHISIQDLLN